MLNLPQNAGVAKLHEVLEDDRAFYIVTERVKGMDLFEMLEHNGNVSLTEGKELIRQLLEALAHLLSNFFRESASLHFIFIVIFVIVRGVWLIITINRNVVLNQGFHSLSFILC